MESKSNNYLAGTVGLPISLLFLSPLTFLKAIHTELGDDGTVTERLDDSSRGQAHRARLLEDPTIREYTPDDDFLPAKRRGGPALRNGLQSSRGGAKVSKHGRIRYVIDHDVHLFLPSFDST